VLLVLLASVPALGCIVYMALEHRRSLLAGAQQEVLTVVRLPAAEQREMVQGTGSFSPARDNPSNVRLLERPLARRPGIELLTAMQGRLGLDLACRHRPDLLLLDRHLPDMDGEELLGRLRADARTRHIPVIVMSADASRGRVRRLLEAGARAYLPKPFDVGEVLELIEQSLTGEATT
jgi:CheY-like chemotaxis protein